MSKKHRKHLEEVDKAILKQLKKLTRHNTIPGQHKYSSSKLTNYSINYRDTLTIANWKRFNTTKSNKNVVLLCKETS